MHLHQLYPLQLNERTREPYLRLPEPLTHIILTPLRTNDEPNLISALNDPRVYKWLTSPPYPYLPEHAKWWLDRTIPQSDGILRELREAEEAGEGQLKMVDSCPVRVLREVKEDGSDVFVGDIGFVRCPWPELVNIKEREALVKENNAKDIGDPSIVWAIADYVVPDYHGKGIMTAAVKTLIREWGIPRMNMRRICITAWIGNVGSVRVFEKNGFVLKNTVEDCGEARGERHGLHVLEWRLED